MTAGITPYTSTSETENGTGEDILSYYYEEAPIGVVDPLPQPSHASELTGATATTTSTTSGLPGTDLRIEDVRHSPEEWNAMPEQSGNDSDDIMTMVLSFDAEGNLTNMQLVN